MKREECLQEGNEVETKRHQCSSQCYQAKRRRLQTTSQSYENPPDASLTRVLMIMQQFHLRCGSAFTNMHRVRVHYRCMPLPQPGHFENLYVSYLSQPSIEQAGMPLRAWRIQSETEPMPKFSSVDQVSIGAPKASQTHFQIASNTVCESTHYSVGLFDLDITNKIAEPK